MSDFYKECFEYLKEMYPHTDHLTIRTIIETVLDSCPDDQQKDQLLNHMVGMLLGSGNNYAEISESSSSSTTGEVHNVQNVSQKQLDSYYCHILEVFPDICPEFLEVFLNDHKKSFMSIDEILDDLSKCDYPIRGLNCEEIIKLLKDMLPNADPSYVEKEAKKLVNKTENDLKMFIDNAIEKEDYPKMEEYIKKQKDLQQKQLYTKNFNPKAFLEEFPNPEEYFGNPNRENPLHNSKPLEETEESENCNDEIEEILDEEYAVRFLLNHYVYLKTRDIKKVFFDFNNKNLYKTCTRLDRIPKCLKYPRKELPDLEEPRNIPLLQEIAFLKHRKLLRSMIKQQDDKYKLSKLDAIQNNLLQTCGCCYDDELIPEECYFCNDGCIFCKQCVKRGAEVQIGEGKLDFPCLANCGSEFSLTTLSMALDRKVFTKMFQRKQIEEVQNAKIDGLETCPFCEFATIPAETDKLFNCQNPDCMKASCRKCRHESHIPLACEEVEFEEDVKLRTYIENKMTEALLRVCWKCGKKFIKESGCNKMTCSCGAKMCYVCKQPVENYNHFSGGKCPLYTQDLEKFHDDLVINGGLQAKNELGLDLEPTKLKKDPMKNISNV